MLSLYYLGMCILKLILWWVGHPAISVIVPAGNHLHFYPCVHYCKVNKALDDAHFQNILFTANWVSSIIGCLEGCLCTERGPLPLHPSRPRTHLRRQLKSVTFFNPSNAKATSVQSTMTQSFLNSIVWEKMAPLDFKIWECLSSDILFYSHNIFLSYKRK